MRSWEQMVQGLPETLLPGKPGIGRGHTESFPLDENLSFGVTVP